MAPPPIEDSFSSFSSCACCDGIALEYTFTDDMLGPFARIEREFWTYVQTVMPLSEARLDSLNVEPFNMLAWVRLDDDTPGAWSLIVEPCSSTYGVEFPSRDFWESTVVIDCREEDGALN